MGVAAFFRWLSEKFPKTLVAVCETKPDEPGEPGVSGAECDNLYVDMNGVIHPCAHPEDRAAPSSEAQVYEDVMLYVDRLVAVTRPKTLVYLAIDGVAPRAKMNQQRSRRWKAAKEAAEKRCLEAETRAELGIEQVVPRARHGRPDEDWDSNVITPGTRFMASLADAVRRGVVERQQRGAKHWRNVAVIVSDASTVGEGEHKIMAFVRDLRRQPGYDPNTIHVLHGLDADLIMLALATHEINFNILREEVLFGRAAREYEERAKQQRDAHAAMCGNGRSSDDKSWIYNKQLQVLKIPVLREYLVVEFAQVSQRVRSFDLENAIDDFVFLCFFCGNDFIPHLPSLDIREGALDLLVATYKKVLPSLGGYVTSHGGHIDLRRLAVLLRHVGNVEDNIFKQRKADEEEKKRRRAGRKRAADQSYASNGGSSFDAAAKKRLLARRMEMKQEAKKDEYSAKFVDEIRLGDEGWKDRYYDRKFIKRDVESGGGCEALAREYVKGLDWVLRYYYAGCASWGWYFPFHYAPFASDLATFVERFVARYDALHPEKKKNREPVWIHESLSSDLEVGRPFSPLQQLMAVLPSASAHALPPACRDLMLSATSPIADFYADDVDVDPNGKAMPWLHVVLLPFVDETRLVKALDAVRVDEDDPSDAVLYVRRGHALAPAVAASRPLPPFIAGELAELPPDRAIVLGRRYPALGLERSDVANAALKPPAPGSHRSALLPDARLPPRALTSREDFHPQPAPKLAGNRMSLADLAGQPRQQHQGALNIPVLQSLAPRSWGSLEPQPKHQPKRPRLIQQPQPLPQPLRHVFAHPTAAPPRPYGAHLSHSYAGGPPFYPASAGASIPPPPQHGGSFDTSPALLDKMKAVLLRRRDQKNASDRV